MYTCMSVYTSVCIYTGVGMCIYKCICMCVHVCTYVCTWLCSCAVVHTCVWNVRVQACVCMCICVLPTRLPPGGWLPPCCAGSCAPVLPRPPGSSQKLQQEGHSCCARPEERGALCWAGSLDQSAAPQPSPRCCALDLGTPAACVRRLTPREAPSTRGHKLLGR